jgi:hypothetical protein
MHISSSPGRSRALLACIAVLACAAVALTATGTATASACGDKILADWWDNGRIDRQYPVNCYHEAIDSIPNDIRDYANVEDVISRALQAAMRGEGPGGPSDPGGDPRQPDPDPGGDDAEVVSDVNTDAPSSIPIPLLLLGAMSVALVGAGGLGYLARRRGALADGGEATDAPPDDAVDV